MVHGRDLHAGAEVILRGVNKVRTQHGSELELRCEFRSVCQGLEQRQGPAGSVHGPECGLRSICRDATGAAPKMLQVQIQDVGSGLILGGSKPHSPALQADSLPSEPSGKSINGLREMNQSDL